jgi:hypothetical protein
VEDVRLVIDEEQPHHGRAVAREAEPTVLTSPSSVAGEAVFRAGEAQLRHSVVDDRGMSLDATIARVAQLETAFSQPVATTAPASAGAPTVSTTGASSTTGGTSPYSSTFATQLQGALATGGVQPVTGTGTGANAIVQIAEGEVGQAEQPPGSNDSPRIAQYRSAVQGASAGEPWCAYFASWVAHQAGVPLGASGQGFGYVGDIWTWAQQTGRAIPNGPGVVPHPGDLILFGDHHVGIVEKVLPNGGVQTIEGNYSDQVSRVIRGAGEATGYVRMG